MPLSHIFSASTSNALYRTKIVIENNSATQPVKETVAFRWQMILQRKFGKLSQGLLQNSYFLVGWISTPDLAYERVLKWDPPSVISPPSPSASCSRRRDCRSGARDAARPRKGEGLETATMTRTNLTENGTSSANPRPVLESLRKMLSDELC